MTRASLQLLSSTDTALGRIHIASTRAPPPQSYVVIRQSDSAGLVMLARANPSPKVTDPSCRFPSRGLRQTPDCASPDPAAVLGTAARRRARPATWPPSAPVPLQRLARPATRLPARPRLPRVTPRAGQTPAGTPRARRRIRGRGLNADRPSLQAVALHLGTLSGALQTSAACCCYLRQDLHARRLHARLPARFAAAGPSPYTAAAGCASGAGSARSIFRSAAFGR